MSDNLDKLQEMAEQAKMGKVTAEALIGQTILVFAECIEDLDRRLKTLEERSKGDG